MKNENDSASRSGGAKPRKRDDPRYHVSPGEVQAYYCYVRDDPTRPKKRPPSWEDQYAYQHKIADTTGEMYGALESALKEKGVACRDRAAVVRLAKDGKIPTYDAAYSVSDSGERVTIAVKLLIPGRAGEAFFKQFSAGPIDILRDTQSSVNGLLGMVAMNARDKVAGTLPWNYSDPISQLWDLGKLRIENAELEDSFAVVFDVVLTEGVFEGLTSRKQTTESLFTRREASPPPLEPFDYAKLKGWENRDWKGFGVDCFSNGVARGTAEELSALAEECGRTGAKLAETGIPGIFEMSLRDFFAYNDGKLYLKDVIERHPGLKIVGFIEDWSPALEVWVLYSESGCPYVTEGKAVGHFDNKSDDPWQWEHSPTEDFTEDFVFLQSGVPMTIRYRFPYRKKWNDGNYYLFKDGKSFLLAPKTASRK